VVAGTATEVSGRVRRRQEKRWNEQEAQQQPQQYAAPPPQAAPPPDSSGGSSTIEQLKELAELKSQGVLTEEEFEQAKAKLLA
jgi:hypothetical protein